MFHGGLFISAEGCWNKIDFQGHNINIQLYVDGLVQDCSNSSALAMELLQSCTKSSIYSYI